MYSTVFLLLFVLFYRLSLCGLVIGASFSSAYFFSLLLQPTFLPTPYLVNHVSAEGQAHSLAMVKPHGMRRIGVLTF